MKTRDIIESIIKLAEEAELGLEEEVLQDIPEEEPELAPAFNDGMSLADTLDAKTKIARCLENLKLAVEEFKEATAEKVDLLKDELLLQGMDELDNSIRGLEVALASGSNILGDSELNDAFKTQLPQAIEEPETEETIEEPAGEEEIEADEDEELGEFNFDDEAGLDLLGSEE